MISFTVVVPTIQPTSQPSGLDTDQKIALGTGIGVPLGVFILGLIPGYLSHKISKRSPGETRSEALANELVHWRKLIWRGNPESREKSERLPMHTQ